MEDATLAPSPTLCFDAADSLYEIPDPLDRVIGEHHGDVLAALKAVGFQLWTVIGDGDGPVPLAIEVYARAKGKPEYLVQLHGSAGSFIESVYADNAYAMMRLLGQWVPTAQAAALVHVVHALNLSPDDENITPAALLAKVGAAGSEAIADKVDDVRRSVDQLSDELERSRLSAR